MRKKSTISPEDLAAFHEAMKDIKPLNKKSIRLAPKVRKPVRTPITEKAIESIPFSDGQNLPYVAGEEFISFSRSGISNKTLRKLKKGQYNVDATLDLHGMTIEEARIAVDGCLQTSLNRGIRVVLIIHGKGHHSQQPILKNKLNHWLREINMVLAFCSAAPIHGSRGATYVLLKRMTGDDLLE